MHADTALVIQRVRQIEAQRAQWRDPAYANAHGAFQRRDLQGVEGIALINKTRQPPALGQAVLVFQTGAEQVTTTDLVPLVIFR